MGSGKGLSLVTDTRVQKLPVVHDRLVVDATQLTVGGQPCWVSVDAFALWLHTVAGKRVTQTLLHRDVPGEAPVILGVENGTDDEVVIAREGGIVERWHVPTRRRRGSPQSRAVTGLGASARGPLVLTDALELL